MVREKDVCSCIFVVTMCVREKLVMKSLFKIEDGSKVGALGLDG